MLIRPKLFATEASPLPLAAQPRQTKIVKANNPLDAAMPA
jgi:hypothetical protein